MMQNNLFRAEDIHEYLGVICTHMVDFYVFEAASILIINHDNLKVP